MRKSKTAKEGKGKRLAQHKCLPLYCACCSSMVSIIILILQMKHVGLIIIRKLLRGLTTPQ